MSDAKSSHQALVVPANSQQVNRLALRWLKEAKAERDPAVAYLPQLAIWGLEQGESLSQPLSPNQPSPEAVQHRLLLLLGAGQEAARQATEWWLQDPNLSRPEQEEALLDLLQSAESPQDAAEKLLDLAQSLMVASS